MKLNELDVIRLKDGSEALVLHVYADGKAFECEFDFSEESDIRTVELSEIDSVIERARDRRKAS